jgi:hypothetical protein
MTTPRGIGPAALLDPATAGSAACARMAGNEQTVKFLPQNGPKPGKGGGPAVAACSAARRAAAKGRRHGKDDLP